jgi:hypothetical protein
VTLPCQVAARSRREADVAGRGRARLNWADRGRSQPAPLATAMRKLRALIDGLANGPSQPVCRRCRWPAAVQVENRIVFAG